ncbi:variant erythrocyte surface antigen-1 family protein, partial [Babesia divergens]
MVCCMYYTDVFVGQTDNIDNLKNALVAELGSSVKTVDLKELEALASGLGFLAGLPACLCKTKKGVKEGLKKIYEELKNFNYCSNSKLNCDLCKSNLYPCKCCVIQSIKEVKGCPCLQTPSNKPKCHCDGKKVSCSKVLAGLEACLHLQCLQSDMEDICKCNGSDTCCQNGKCDGKSGVSCEFCLKLKSNTPVPTTGLGLSPPNPIRLAGRLDKFFGDNGRKDPCSCQCGTSNESCCCLACTDKKCSESCNSECRSSGKCGHQSQPSQGCPCKAFCLAINDIKIPAQARDRTCCEGGQKCHCGLAGSGSNCSGQNCCVVTSGRNSYHSLKCLIRRLVNFFNGLSLDSSNKDCSKLCCELLCVRMHCWALGQIYNKGLKECSKCKPGGTGKTCPAGTKGNSCCNGNPSACASNSTPNCCVGCNDCSAIKFRNAFETLRFAGPCGQDLYRTLDSFLYYCCNVFRPYVERIQGTVKEARKSCSQCKSKKTGTFPCQCSSGSDCTACQEILKDPQLKVILLSQYVSSYDSSNAKWESLCSSSGPCCGSSCPQDCSSSNPSCPTPCTSGSSCPDNGCCEKCPKRLCAKIFLGMLPCLYYGLKIVFDRCKYGSDFPDWSLRKITEGSIGSFLGAWGFTSSNLSSKYASGLPPVLDILFGSSESPGTFDKIYDFVSQKYFSKHVSDSQLKPPQTVRQMLLWLYGLPYTSGFHDLVSLCRTLSLPLDNAFHPDAVCYYIYTCCFIVPVAVISTIETSDSAQKAFSSSSEFSKFLYPSDPSSLADMLFKYIRKVYIAFNFLRFQCKLTPGQAGWQNCYFGKECKPAVNSSSSSLSTSGSPSGSTSGCSCPNSDTYLCTAFGSNKDVHGKHCWEGKCLGSSSTCDGKAHSQGQCKNPCPHPLLMFLVDGSSESQSQDSSPFRLPFSFARLDFSQTPPVILDASSDKFLTMGFSKSNLPSPGKKGFDLGHDIYGFCKDGFYPLTRLVQFILCISQRPPETLLDLYAFFKKFVEALNSKPELSSTFVQWINGEPGWFLGNSLKDAVRGLYGSQDSHSGSSHSADLFSLSSCHANKGSKATCGKYLYPLTDNVAGVFTPELCSMYLSWICHLTKDFKALLEKFKKDFSKSCEHCSSGSCQKIVECPCALPFLYSWGFSFWSPGDLNCVTPSGNSKHTGENSKGEHFEGDSKCTQKSCFEFIIQLERVISGKPFEKLLDAIEAFLWSIRFPFFFGFLYVWFFVLSYFCYVILIKLDTFHTGSHLHLPRSFKILPST